MRIRIFGALRLTQAFARDVNNSAVNDRNLPADCNANLLGRPRARSLLGWLLIHHGDHLRSYCADTLWPDSTHSQAMTNLRRELHSLKPVLELIPDNLVLNRQSVGIRRDGGLDVDLWEFESLFKQFQQETAAPLQTELGFCLMELCQYELLEGANDEWIVNKRQQLNLQRRQIARELTALLKNQSRWDEAETVIRRRLDEDAVNEWAMMDLLEVLVATGRQIEARFTALEFTNVLRHDLNVNPGAEFQAVVEAIDRRYIYTESVDRILQESDVPLEKGKVKQSNSEIRSEQITPKKAELLEPQFVGREVLLDALTDQIKTMVRSREESRTATPTGYLPVLTIIEGEAGSGKSRLLEEALNARDPSTSHLYYSRCVEGVAKPSCSIIADWVRENFEPERLPKNNADILVNSFPQLGESNSTLVSNPDDRRKSGQVPGTVLFEIITQYLMLNNQPLVLVIDDLQWSDQDSIEWLVWFVQFRCEQPVLVLATQRLEEIENKQSLQKLRNLAARVTDFRCYELSPLESASAEALVLQMLPDSSTDNRQLLRNEILLKSEGNPLFLIEMCRTCSSRQSAGLERSDQLPARVQGIVNQRLDNLSPIAEQTGMVAAVLGRAVKWTILQRVLQLPESELLDALEELSRHRVFTGQHDTLCFSHDLIRSALYERLSAPRRQFIHQRCALAYQQDYGRYDNNGYSSAIGYHLEAANDPVNASEWYYRAALYSAERLVSREALVLCRRARELYESACESPDPDRVVDMLVSEASLASLIHGFASDAVRQANKRMQNLLPRLTDQLLKFQAINRIRMTVSFSKDSSDALEISRRLEIVAQQTGNATCIIESYRSTGFCHYVLGEMEKSQARYRKAMEVGHQAIQDKIFALEELPFSHLKVCNSLSLLLAIAGRTAEAKRVLDRTGSLNIYHLDTNMQAHILLSGALATCMLRDEDRLRELVHRFEELIELKGRYPKLVVFHGMYKGWIEARSDTQGIATMEHAVDVCNQLEEDHFVPLWHSMLSDACLKHDQVERAHYYAQTGIQTAEILNQKFAIVDLYRCLSMTTHKLGLLEPLLSESQLRQFREVDRLQALAIQVAKGQKALLILIRVYVSRLTCLLGRLDCGFSPGDTVREIGITIEECQELLERLDKLGFSQDTIDARELLRDPVLQACRPVPTVHEAKVESLVSPSA